MLTINKLLPQGRGLAGALLKRAASVELDWDVRLLLKRDEVPRLILGGGTRLGWTTWLGRRRETTAADDLLVDPEAFAANGAHAA